MRRACGSMRSLASARYWPPLWSPASLTRRPSDQGATSRLGSGWCRSSTRAGAKTGSAVSASKGTAICAACSCLWLLSLRQVGRHSLSVGEAAEEPAGRGATMATARRKATGSARQRPAGNRWLDPHAADLNLSLHARARGCRQTAPPLRMVGPLGRSSCRRVSLGQTAHFPRRAEPGSCPAQKIRLG